MSKTIMIVDDEANARVTLTDILLEQGYKVIEACNGNEALEKVKKWKPDLALVDTKLPDINGIGVSQQIKQMCGVDTKVIVYTGYVDAVDIVKARAAGADDYIVKTADFSLFTKAIRRLI